MVSFDKVLTPAVEFGGADVRTVDGPHRDVLWPVLGWRVVVPTPVDRHLNAFQAAVLRLALIERTQPAEVASLLHLEVDLVRFIQAELRSEGLVGLDGRPTPLGQELLGRDDGPPELQDRAGWVFTDPDSGELWPRFIVGELPFIELDRETGHEPRRVQSPGRGPGALVRLVLPERSRFPEKPSPRAILQAAQAHRRSVARTDSGYGAAVKRVSHVSDHPHPLLVLVRFSLDDRGRLDAVGMLGEVVLPGFIDLVQTRCGRDEGLNKLVLGLFERAGEGLSELGNQAVFTVESELTTAIRRFPSVHDLLVSTERAWLESQAEDSPPDKRDDVFVKAQKACEAILDDVLMRFPVRSPLPWREAAAIAELIHAAASALGFAALPKSLAFVRPGKIQAALQGDAGLRPLLLAHLLGALEYDAHPMRHAARASGSLLTELDTLARWRDGRAAHYSRPKRRQKVTAPAREVAEASVRLTRQLAKWLLLDAAHSG